MTARKGRRGYSVSSSLLGEFLSAYEEVSNNYVVCVGGIVLFDINVGKRVIVFCDAM